MSKELINRLIRLAICLGVTLLFMLLGASERAVIVLYAVTLTGLNLGDIADAIRERPLNVYMDKSFLDRIIESLKNRDNEQRD